ncbi:MAG: glycosyltransferase family 9 protein [Candidatus Nanoarchaeia archaeon]|nr:glycosyltransferase family 9 protein [Candidatus Nanoarchaeia archaeon]MDD5741434.1 glycosyltransferase family 9 protein [Candidatus Nanoarchaeia archaeon]
MDPKLINPKKILVIKNDHIGDLIFYSGVFRELKREYPKTRITVIASKANKPIIEKNKDIDEIIIMPHGKKFLKSFYKYPFILNKIRREKFDIGFDLRGDFLNTFFLLYMGNVKYKIGFYTKFPSRFLLEHSEKRGLNNHEIDNMLKILNNGLGLNVKNNWPEIAIDSKDIKEAEDFIKKNRLKKFICIAFDSNTPARQWALEEFDRVIKYLKKDYPEYQIVLCGIDEEKMNWLTKRNKNMIKLGKVNIRMIYPLLKRSSLTISLDNGISHIVWVGKTKLIVIQLKESIIDHKNTEPLGKNSRTILETNEKVKAEKVIETVKSFLKKK